MHVRTQRRARILALGAVGLACTIPATLTAEADRNDPVTFYRDVLPIVQQNCQACHRPFGVNMGGMVAPMSFMDYDEVRPWAKSMARAVAARDMPPWLAKPEFGGVFRNELSLTGDEIDTIVRWAREGAVAGDETHAPEAHLWTNAEWKLGKPDLIVQLPEPFFIADGVEDTYVDFDVTLTAEMLPEPRYIRASEARGSSMVVHHIIARPLGFMAPGGGHKEYPKGFGKRIKAGDKVTFNMHYHKEPGEGTGVWDQSAIALWFHDTPVLHQIWTGAIGHWDFEIPPGADDWKVGSSLTFPYDSTIVGFVPHMHLRGKSLSLEAFYPDGTSELLLAADYDFYWQARYDFIQPRTVPAGTRIEFIAHFDNSPDGAYNPDPLATVRFGDPTTEEMSLIFVDWTRAEPQIPEDVLSLSPASAH